MKKLERYLIEDLTDECVVCLSADVRDVEAQRDQLLDAVGRYRRCCEESEYDTFDERVQTLLNLFELADRIREGDA